MADVIVSVLLVILEQSWRLEKCPKTRGKANDPANLRNNASLGKQRLGRLK